MTITKQQFKQLIREEVHAQQLNEGLGRVVLGAVKNLIKKLLAKKKVAKKALPYGPLKLKPSIAAKQDKRPLQAEIDELHDLDGIIKLLHNYDPANLKHDDLMIIDDILSQHANTWPGSASDKVIKDKVNKIYDLFNQWDRPSVRSSIKSLVTPEEIKSVNYMLRHSDPKDWTLDQFRAFEHVVDNAPHDVADDMVYLYDSWKTRTLHESLK